jgi:small-conductance mechanosensitive channel
LIVELRGIYAETSIMSFFQLHRILLIVVITIIAISGWSAARAQQAQRTPADYGISTEWQADLKDADTQVWLNRLDDIELILGKNDIPGESRARAMRDVKAISNEAKTRLQVERDRLKPINRELESLGSPPAEGEAESEDIANLRHEVGERIAKVEFHLRQIQLVLVRAENLELSLIGLAESPLFDRLLIRSPILWQVKTWRIAGAHLVALVRAVAEAPEAWWRSKTGTEEPFKLPLALSAGLIALFLGVPARRWLQRRFGRQENELDPSYARRIGAAFVTAVVDVLLPSLALGAIALAIWLLSHDDTLLPSLAISACLGGMSFFILAGLSRAVLAPQAPGWRILPVTEEGAVVLNRRVGIVALYIGVLQVVYGTARFLGLLQSPEFETVISLFTDALLAGLLLTLLPSRFWQTDEENESGPVVVGVSITLGVLLITIPILNLVGFSRLASYLLWVLIISVVATGFAILLRVAGHEALAQMLRPASTLRLRLYRWLRLGEGAANVMRMLGGFLIDLILFIALSYTLLRVYGLPNALILHWVEKISDGIPIGSILLSPVDIVVAILVFVGTILATGMLRRWLAETLRTGTRLDLGVRNAIVSGVGYGGIVLAIVVTIAIVGLDLSNLALVAGALSVGVGFGLRTVVENFVAGLLLLIERPIKEGDWIVTAGYQGKVKRISVRSTEVETFDRASVIVPNAELVAQPVQNWTHKNRMARIIVPVGVAYGSDTAKVREILLACADKHPEVLRYPEPYIIFQQFGASSLDFELRCYLKDTDFVLSCKSDLNFAIDKAFREQEIEIPFPQRDLHVRGGTPMQVTVIEQQQSTSASLPSSPAKPHRLARRRRHAETNGGDADE